MQTTLREMLVLAKMGQQIELSSDDCSPVELMLLLKTRNEIVYTTETHYSVAYYLRDQIPIVYNGFLLNKDDALVTIVCEK